MLSNVILPKQGLMMTEGTIVRWLVREGETARKGEPLFEMETDKLTISIDALASGRLLKIVHGDGETVPVAEIIAYIGDEGDSVPAAEKTAASLPEPAVTEAVETPAAPAAVGTAGKRNAATPRARMTAAEKKIDLADVTPTGPDGAIIERDVLNYRPVRATPLARAVAQSSGVELRNVSSTGAYGRVTKEDVLAACKTGESSVPCEETLIPLTGMRRVVARRMLESQKVNAATFHCVSVDMTNAGKLREVFKKQNKRISYNDIVLLAAVKALREVPYMNAVFTDEGILLKKSVNIGMAVAVDNGLIVPNIKNADKMGLEQLADAAHDMAERAKSNRLSPEDCVGGTFTVSNLGMYGLDFFYPIINMPEAGILGVGAIKKMPVVADDTIVIRPMMNLTLTYDHRIADGALAAEFISKVRAYLEEPYLLL